MKLFQHQREILEQNPKYHGLWFETGLGKTLTAIKLVEQNADTALIVCPKSLKENWRREIDKWSDKLVAWEIVSKEEFRKDFMPLAHIGYEALVLDEVHYFEGYKSQMHKNLIKYLQLVEPKCLYGLTATPMMASPYCVFALLRIFGKNPNWRKFTETFFRRQRMGPRMIWVPRAGKDGHLQQIIASLGTLRRKKDCLDLPDQIFQREDFALTTDQKRALKALDDDPTMVTPIVKWTAHHQIMGGTLKSADLKLNTQASARLLEYADEHKKLVVVCRYNAEIAMLKELMETRDHTVHVLNGQTKNRQQVIDNFIEDPRAVFLVNAAVSEGYNLPGVGIMVFYSLSFSLKDRIQMLGRIHGSGRGIEGEPSVYVDFVIPGTISEDVYETILAKQDFQCELYEQT